jgi:hypothetical protein
MFGTLIKKMGGGGERERERERERKKGNNSTDVTPTFIWKLLYCTLLENIKLSSPKFAPLLHVCSFTMF